MSFACTVLLELTPPDATILPAGPVKSKVPDIAAEPVNGKAVPGKFVKSEPSPVKEPVKEPVSLVRALVLSLTMWWAVIVEPAVLALKSPEYVTGPTKFRPS